MYIELYLLFMLLEFVIEIIYIIGIETKCLKLLPEKKSFFQNTHRIKVI